MLPNFLWKKKEKTINFNDRNNILNNHNYNRNNHHNKHHKCIVIVKIIKQINLNFIVFIIIISIVKLIRTKSKKKDDKIFIEIPSQSVDFSEIIVSFSSKKKLFSSVHLDS